MTIGIAAFITIRQSDYTSVVARYQNYWPGQTVDDYSFYPFNVNAILSNASGGQDSLSVDFAASPSIITIAEDGLVLGYLVEIAFYQFAPALDGGLPASKTIFATFIGELASVSQGESDITFNIGSTLNAVEAQAPPRKFTTVLIGSPPKL